MGAIKYIDSHVHSENGPAIRTISNLAKGDSAKLLETTKGTLINSKAYVLGITTWMLSGLCKSA